MTQTVKSFLDTIDLQADNIWLILGVFLREMDGCFIQLDNAIKQNDVAASRAELHQMIGAASILNDSELEEILTNIQKTVKSKQPTRSSEHLLLKIKSHLDTIFNYLFDFRPSYQAYFMSDEVSESSIPEALQNTDTSIKCAHTSSVNEGLSYLADHEVEILMVKYDEEKDTFRELQELLQSAYIDSPILLVVDKPVIRNKEISSSYQNIHGSIQTSADLNEWVKAIKTIVNGRDYWLNNG